MLARSRLPAVSLVLITSTLGCAHDARHSTRSHDPAAVRAAIERTLAEFGAAMKRGDAAAIGSMFTEDGEYATAAAKGFTTGRQAIEAVFAARFMAARFVDVVITTATVQVAGDTAYETGTNRVVVQTGDAPPVTRTGRYLTVWKREGDGVWRIRIDAIIPDPSP